MSQKLENDAVKIERYILFTKEAGKHQVRPSSSLYLLVPSPIVDLLKQRNIDLRKLKENPLLILCSLAIETDGPKLLYSFSQQNEKEE